MAQRRFSLPHNRFLWLGGLALVVGLIALWVVSARPTASPQQQLIDEIERELGRVQTVQGRLTLSVQDVTLEQELWVQRPLLLRTETASGPSAFQGTIVVLNDQEGWVYSPALDMATVVDRSNYSAEVAGEPGAGSLLERMPDSILAALRGGSPLARGNPESIAGRQASLLEITIGPDDAAFPPGPLRVWLDEEYSYPLAWQDSSRRSLRFSSIVFNAAIDPVTFVFFPPPGAAVQRIAPQP